MLLPMNLSTVSKSDLVFEHTPVTLVIPDTVETIEEGVLSSLFGNNEIEKRCIVIPERLSGTIDKEWEDIRPEIIYY